MNPEAINLVILSISLGISVVISFIGLNNFKQKREYRNELFKLEQEQELLHYYLRNEATKDSLDRSANNNIYLRNANFDTIGYQERLLSEVSRLRKDIRNFNETQSKQLDELKKSEHLEGEFDYHELIYQISSMTNIQYLFELLQEEKDGQFGIVRNVLADIVHTIRNPVSSIRTLIAIMRMEGVECNFGEKISDIEKYIEQIEANLNAYYEMSHMESADVGQSVCINLREELLGKVD